MENFQVLDTKAVTEKRVEQLTTSISSLRIAEKSDIILVCDGREFPAHKVILEASSPYFESMFHSGMQEAKSGKVKFENMEPETLEAILDFIYQGKICKLKTIAQMKEILHVSQMMHLDDLFTYCCEVFLSTLSVNNFCNVWDVATLYNRGKILAPLLDFMFDNRVEILATNEFLCLSPQHLQEYLQVSVTKQLCMNEMLGGLMKWLHEDETTRKVYAEQMLQCISVELVTQQFVSSLINDVDLMLSSKEIRVSLYAFAAKVLVWVSERTEITPAAINCGKACIVFSSGYQQHANAKLSNWQVNYRSNSWPTFIQQFDVQNMLWLPVQVVGADMLGAVFAQNKDYVYAAGGKLGTAVILYNVCTRAVEYTNWALFQDTMNAGMCISDEIVARVGGSDSLANYIYFANQTDLKLPCNHNRQRTITYPRCSPIVLIASDCLFIIGGNDPKEGLVIEFVFDPNSQTNTLEIQRIPNIPDNLTSYFFIANDTMHGFFFGNDSFIKLKFNKTTKRLETTHFSLQPPDKQVVTGMYQYPDHDVSMIFVSTIQDGPSFPNYLWEPDANKWIKLPIPKGRCSLPRSGTIQNKMFVVEKPID